MIKEFPESSVSLDLKADKLLYEHRLSLRNGHITIRVLNGRRFDTFCYALS